MAGGMTMDRNFRRIDPAGHGEAIVRTLATESPVAIEVNGIGYAVMMATPADLADFALGFALAERIIATPDELIDCDLHTTDDGDIVRLTVALERAAAVADRVRRRTGDSACGLCGMDNLAAVHRPLPSVPPSRAEPPAIFAALAAMRAHQPLNAATGAAHAAMLCAPDGTIRLAREDVGRHNAFDKLIGAMARGAFRWNGGFALLSSRCSYELVEKAALAACPMLVTVSAATSLAVARAAACGLTLVTLARSDSALFPDTGAATTGP